MHRQVEYVHPQWNKKGKLSNPSAEVMAQILGYMGMEMKKTDGNQLPKSVTEKWDHKG